MSYNVKIFQSLNEIEKFQWSLSGEKLPISMNFDYLKLIEMNHANEIDFFYGLVQQGDFTIGVFSFQLIEFKGAYVKNFFRDEVERGFIKNIFLKIFYKLLDRLKWNLLTVGNIYFTGDHGIYFNSNIQLEKRVEIIHQVFNKVKQLSKKKVSAFMVNNVYDNNSPAIHKYLNKYNYATYPVDPDMFFKFNSNWNTFEDYTKAISSKYRVRMKKVYKQSSNIESKILSKNDIEQLSERMYQLYMNTAQKVQLNLGYLAANYFLKMTHLWKDSFKIIGYFFEEKLVGFMSILIDEKDMDVNYMGLDYSVNYKTNLYNRMLFDLVKLGINLNAETMHLGRTATEIKSTIGASAKPMHIFLRGTNFILNKGMKFFEPYFGSPQYTLRSPFKKLS